MRMMNIALPKGRLGDKAYAVLARAGYACPAIGEDSRQLTFVSPDGSVRYFLVKPADVAIYVERGAADVGIAGKDILLEYAPDVYELLDLGMGRCRMCVAGPKGFADDHARTLRVATKFPHIAARHYSARSREIELIHLNGSIELAPIVGLSDVIVDIVETGATLRENGLDVLEEIVPISDRLIANKTAFKFKREEIRTLAERTQKSLAEKPA